MNDQLLIMMTKLIMDWGPHAVNQAFVSVCRDFAGDAAREGKMDRNWQWHTIASRAAGATTINGEEILRKGESQ